MVRRQDERRERTGTWIKPERSAVGICTKHTIFFINFSLVIIGLVMAGVGIYILTLKQKQLTNPILFFLDPACMTCLGGSIIFLLGFLGCIGSLREITCFLKMYYYGLSLLLLVEVVLAIAMFLSYYVPEVKGYVFPKDAFRSAIEGYRDDPDMQNLIDSMQEQLSCCGYSDNDGGYLDWNGNIYFNCTHSNPSPERCSVPYSCCVRKSGEPINYQCGSKIAIIQDDKTIVPNDKRLDKIHKVGCIRALGQWIDDHSLLVAGVMLGVILPQIFIIVLSRNLIYMINLQRSKWKHSL